LILSIKSLLFPKNGANKNSTLKTLLKTYIFFIILTIKSKMIPEAPAAIKPTKIIIKTIV